MPVISATTGSINRRVMVQAGPAIKQNAISKISVVRRAGGMAEAVEHLPSKSEFPNLNPSTTIN
jgi:hypothetical protein